MLLEAEENTQAQEERAHQADIRQICNICGRKFNPASLERHQRVCQKVFGSTRPQFDPKKGSTLTSKNSPVATAAPVKTAKADDRKLGRAVPTAAQPWAGRRTPPVPTPPEPAPTPTPLAPSTVPALSLWSQAQRPVPVPVREPSVAASGAFSPEAASTAGSRLLLPTSAVESIASPGAVSPSTSLSASPTASLSASPPPGQTVAAHAAVEEVLVLETCTDRDSIQEQEQRVLQMLQAQMEELQEMKRRCHQAAGAASHLPSPTDAAGAEDTISAFLENIQEEPEVKTEPPRLRLPVRAGGQLFTAAGRDCKGRALCAAYVAPATVSTGTSSASSSRPSKIASGDGEASPSASQAGLKICEDCGRRFNPSSFEKHRLVCRSVFGKSSRSPFESQSQRLRALPVSTTPPRPRPVSPPRGSPDRPDPSDSRSATMLAARRAARQQQSPQPQQTQPMQPVHQQQRTAGSASPLPSRGQGAGDVPTSGAEEAAPLCAPGGGLSAPNAAGRHRLTSPSRALEQCPHCKRSFRPGALDKHVKICQSVFPTNDPRAGAPRQPNPLGRPPDRRPRPRASVQEAFTEAPCALDCRACSSTPPCPAPAASTASAVGVLACMQPAPAQQQGGRTSPSASRSPKVQLRRSASESHIATPLPSQPPSGPQAPSWRFEGSSAPTPPHAEVVTLERDGLVPKEVILPAPAAPSLAAVAVVSQVHTTLGPAEEPSLGASAPATNTVVRARTDGHGGMLGAGGISAGDRRGLLERARLGMKMGLANAGLHVEATPLNSSASASGIGSLSTSGGAETKVPTLSSSASCPRVPGGHVASVAAAVAAVEVVCSRSLPSPQASTLGSSASCSAARFGATLASSPSQGLNSSTSCSVARFCTSGSSNNAASPASLTASCSESSLRASSARKRRNFGSPLEEARVARHGAARSPEGLRPSEAAAALRPREASPAREEPPQDMLSRSQPSLPSSRTCDATSVQARTQRPPQGGGPVRQTSASPERSGRWRNSGGGLPSAERRGRSSEDFRSCYARCLEHLEGTQQAPVRARGQTIGAAASLSSSLSDARLAARREGGGSLKPTTFPSSEEHVEPLRRSGFPTTSMPPTRSAAAPASKGAAQSCGSAVGVPEGQALTTGAAQNPHGGLPSSHGAAEVHRQASSAASGAGGPWGVTLLTDQGPGPGVPIVSPGSSPNPLTPSSYFGMPRLIVPRIDMRKVNAPHDRQRATVQATSQQASWL